MRILKKALPIWGAFFIAYHSQVFAQCGNASLSEPVVIAHVYDGDTVKLEDGRRVRLIGLNATEVGKDGRESEPWADAATYRLKAILGEGAARLSLGVQKQDRYKRWLGHLYINGELLAERLLKEGVAYHINIPPNSVFSECLKAAELEAAEDKRGLWQTSPWRAVSSLKDNESGFRLLKGKVTALKSIRSGWILEIDDLLAVKISRAVGDSLLAVLSSPNLIGRTIAVRGWIRPKAVNAPAHYQPWFMVLTHKVHLQPHFF